jgi:hypothetical protein
MSHIRTIFVEAFQIVTGDDWVRSADLYFFFGSNQGRPVTTQARPGQSQATDNATMASFKS